MIPAQRQQRIVSLLEERGGVISINDLVDLLGVSHMTIRRDLMLLEQEKMVDSVSGGVRLHNQLIHDPTLQMKENFATEEKNRIGKEAAKYNRVDRFHIYSKFYLEHLEHFYLIQVHVFDFSKANIVYENMI